MSPLHCFAIASTLALVTGCGSSTSHSEDPTNVVDALRLDVCGTTTTGADVRNMLEGDLFIAGTYAEQGYTAGDLALGLGAEMLVNGIDFTKPTPHYTFEHTNGDYSFTDVKSGWTLSLTFAKDVGGFKAGDKIPDLFSVDNYVKNVHLDSDLNIAYEPGPLAVLVDGSVQIDTSTFTVHAKVRGDLIALSLSSVGTWHGSWLRQADTFEWHMTTLTATLADLSNQVKTGAGYGLTFQGSHYQSPTFGIDQTFGAASVMAIKDGTRSDIEGGYDATLKKGSLALTQRGFVSSRTNNRTEYYCDAARTQRLGVARHALDLKSGTFVLDKDGTKIPYSIEGF
jgi:hypothetical protein